MKYTVVGIYPEDRGDYTVFSYVEHVEADSVEAAIAEAVRIDLERTDGQAIAVFKGHRIDVGPEGRDAIGIVEHVKA